MTTPLSTTQPTDNFPKWNDDETWFIFNYTVFGNKFFSTITTPLENSIEAVASCAKASLCHSESTDSTIDKIADFSKKTVRVSTSTSVSTSRGSVMSVDSCLKGAAHLEFPKNPDGSHQPIPIVHSNPNWMLNEDSSDDEGL
jgi:hypothetical protein